MKHVRGDDRGETLIELIVAIAILGIGAVAILAAFQMSITFSDMGRKQANSDSAVRGLAEAIQNSVNTSGTYKPCALPNVYVTSAVRTQAGIPAGYTANQGQAQSWDGTSWTTSGPCSDTGVQRLQLTVTSPAAANPGGKAVASVETLTMILRKPCSGAPGATACS